jgi:hypothetical protein
MATAQLQLMERARKDDESAGDSWITQQVGREKENRGRRILGESLQRTAGHIQLQEAGELAMRFVLSELSQGAPHGKPGK